MKRVSPLGLVLLALSCGGTEKPANPNTSGGQGVAGASTSTAGTNASGNAGSTSGGTSSGGAPGGSGGSLDSIGVALGDTPAEACIAYAWAVCSRVGACREGIHGAYNCSGATLDCPDLSFSPGATRTVAVLKECAATYATLPCEEVRAEKLPTCVTPGARMRGEECEYASQCSSLSCATRDAVCGTCGVRAVQGESCAESDVECEVGTTCNTATHICEPPLTGPLPGANEACMPGGLCQIGYYCQGDGSGGGICRAFANANESCAAAPCVSGHYCSSDSLCKPYPVPGQPCGLDRSGALICDGPGICETAADGMSGTCRPTPEAGQPCLTSDGNGTGYCTGIGLHCDNTATPPVCKGPGKAGEVCLTGNDCLGLSSCACDDPLVGDCPVKHCTELHVANQPCTAPYTRCHPAFECIAGTCQPLTLRGDFTAACGP